MKRNSVLIFLGAVLIWISMYVYVPVLPVYAQQLGASASTIGLISGVYGVLPIALCAPLGFIAGALTNEKKYLVVGFAIAALSGLVFLLWRSVTGLLIARAIAAAASGWWVIIAAAYAKYQPADQQVKAQGHLNFGSNFGKIIGCIICLLIADSIGMDAVFMVALVTGIIGLVLMFGLQRSKSASQKARVPMRKEMALFKNKDILRFSVLALIAQMISFAVPVTFTPIAAKALGANDTILSLIQLVYVVGVAVSCLFVGTKKYKALGGIRVMVIGFIISAVSCVPYFYKNYGTIVLMQILSSLIYGIALAALSGYVVKAVPDAQQTSALGVFESIYSIGIFIGPTVAGALVQFLTFGGAYWFFVGLSVVAAVLCPILIPKKYDHMG